MRLLEFEAEMRYLSQEMERLKRDYDVVEGHRVELMKLLPEYTPEEDSEVISETSEF